jgi:hypothetical protein
MAIAGDDDAIQLSGLTNLDINPQVFHDALPIPVPFDHLLILGWNRRAPIILEQLRHYAPPGSQVRVFAPYPIEQMQADWGEANYHPIQVTFEQGNPVDRPSLEQLAESSFPFVLILSPTDAADIQLADALRWSHSCM